MDWIPTGHRLCGSGNLQLRHNFHPDRCNTVMLHMENQETATAINQRLLLLREIPFMARSIPASVSQSSATGA